VYVIDPVRQTSSTTIHVPWKRPCILMPGFGTADTHRISDETGVISTRQMFGSRDTAYVFDPAELWPARANENLGSVVVVLLNDERPPPRASHLHVTVKHDGSGRRGGCEAVGRGTGGLDRCRTSYADSC
jgi:hypothetical protein